MANIAISSKSTKTEIMTFLRDTFKEVAELDKTLAKTIKYASDQIKKDAKSVTKADLLDLAQQVMQLTGVITKPVEMSSKLGSKSTPLASIFPPEFTFEGFKFIAVPFKYQTMDEIRDVINQENKNSLIFAAYWTKRHIRQFNYADNFKLKKTVSEDLEFENDMDIVIPQFALNMEDTIVAVSAYTEAVYSFKGEELKVVEDTDSDGNKYVLRFSNGMEFQIYELVDEDNDNEATEKADESEEEEQETSEKEEDKESQSSKDEKTTGHKKKFSAKGKKTSDTKDEVTADDKSEEKTNPADNAE